MLARLCTALVAALIVSASATAQVITGTLLERGSDQPIDLGYIALLTESGEAIASTITNQNGRFTVRSPEPGAFLVGFYERVQRGLGHFITPEDIEKSPALSTAELFFGIPGVQLAPTTSGNQVVMTGTRGLCPPTTYVGRCANRRGNDRIDRSTPDGLRDRGLPPWRGDPDRILGRAIRSHRQLWCRLDLDEEVVVRGGPLR